MSRLLVGVPSRGPSPRPSACGPRQPLDGVGPIWSASALAAHRLRRSRPVRPCGHPGRIATGSAVAVSGSGDHHGSLASVGVTWHAETKNPPRGGHFGSLGAETPWTSGNRFEGTVLPKHLPSLRHDGACIKQIPSDPCYRWLQPLAIRRVSRDWVQELLPWGRCSRAERGDSAHGPNAQRRTAAQIHTQAGMRRQARRPLNRFRRHSNREGVVLGGGALSERAEGRQEAGNGIQVR